MSAEQDVDRKVLAAFFPDPGFQGVLVEVGAARPDYLSISAGFRRHGWKVVAIEPNPEFCAAHRALGYDVLQYACSDVEQDDAEFFVVDFQGAPYLSGNVSFESFSSLGIRGEFAAQHKKVEDKTTVHTIPVKVRKLDTILAEHAPGVVHVDVVAVDVEGWELNVMKGFSIGKYRPRVIILENLFKSDSYVTHMEREGYKLWSRLEPNDIYARADLANTKPVSEYGLFARVAKRISGR